MPAERGEAGKPPGLPRPDHALALGKGRVHHSVIGSHEPMMARASAEHHGGMVDTVQHLASHRPALPAAPPPLSDETAAVPPGRSSPTAMSSPPPSSYTPFGPQEIKSQPFLWIGPGQR